MMRGYQCQHKTAKKILQTLGFDPTLAIRGWVINRTGGLKNDGAPIRMHAIVQTADDGTEYIDIHADQAGPGGVHVTQRGRRTERWNQLFSQVDASVWCDVGQKIIAHYNAVGPAVAKYNSKLPYGKRRN